MSLPLFEIPMQKGAGIEIGRPVDAGDAHSSVRASSDYAVEAPPQGSSRSAADDVRRARGSEIPQFEDGSALNRIFTHRYGTFLHLRHEAEPREYRVIELVDGRLFDEFLDDGERRVSRFSHDELEQGLREVKFREVNIG